MNREDLFATLDQARTSAFRMETQRQYLVPAEADDFAAWQAGRRHALDTPQTNDWLARVRSDTERGFRWYRTRIVGPPPLTVYEEFELYGLQANAAAGEQVLVADRAWRPDLDRLRDDWWLFDDEALVLMRYDGEGHWLGGQLVVVDGDLDHELERHRRDRDLALGIAVPLGEYWPPGAVRDG